MAKKKIAEVYVGLGLNSANFTEGLKNAEKLLKNFGNSSAKLGRDFVKISAPLAAVSTAIGVFGKEYAEAFSEIKKVTGKGSDELEGLKTTFRNLAISGDDSMQEVASALAGLVKITGISGQELEGLTDKILDLSQVTGAELNSVISLSDQLIKSWGLSVEQTAEALDVIYKVAQNSGVGIDQLTQSLSNSRTILSAYGLSFEESAILIGNFAKTGANVEQVINGLKIALTEFSDQGLLPQDALSKLTQSIQSSDIATGNLIAKNVVGRKTFLDFADAARKGAFDTQEFKNQLGQFAGAIEESANKTKGIGQILAGITNPIRVLLGEVGAGIVTSGIKLFAEDVGEFTRNIQELTKYLLDNYSTALKVGGAFVLIGASIAPLLFALKGVSIAFALIVASPIALTIGAISTALIGGAILWQEYGTKVKQIFIDVGAELERFRVRVLSGFVELRARVRELATLNFKNPFEVADKEANEYLQQKLNEIQIKQEKETLDLLKDQEKATKKITEASKKLNETKAKFASPKVTGIAETVAGKEKITNQKTTDDFTQSDFNKLKSDLEKSFKENKIEKEKSFFEITDAQADQIASAIGNALANELSTVFKDVLNGKSVRGSLAGAFGNIGAAAGQAFGTAFAGPVGGAIGGAIGDVIGNKVGGAVAKLGKSREETIQGVKKLAPLFAVALQNPLLGALGTSSIESVFGVGNKDKSARKQFKNLILNIFEDAGLTFSDAVGRSFKIPKNAFQSLEDQAKSGLPNIRELVDAKGISKELQGTFQGLGLAFAQIFNLPKDLANQFGDLLAFNLEDSAGLNELQIALQGAGLTAEEMGKKLEQGFLSGSLSAKEYLASLNATRQVMADGIPAAIGGVEIAFNNLINGGLKDGLHGLDALKDLAFESGEANIKSLQELGNVLVQRGADASSVSTLLQELSNQGIRTLEDLKKIDSEKGANILSGLEDAGFNFKEITDDVKELGASIQSINDIEFKPKILEVNVKATGDIGLIDDQVDLNALGGVYKNITAFAQGGIVNSPTMFKHSGGLGIMGEAGAEAIMPLQRIGGKLGVSAVVDSPRATGAVSFNIDARGAANGVEDNIRMVLADFEESLINKTLGAVIELSDRGAI